MNKDNQTPPKENKNLPEQPDQSDASERKMYIQKAYKEILTEKWQDFKKFARIHMPHFVHAWHAKVDVYVFRYTLGGIGIFFILVLLIAMMAGMNQGKDRTTGTKASEDGKDTIKVEETGEDWRVVVDPATSRDIYGFYVSFCNEKNTVGYRFINDDAYLTKNTFTTDLVELSANDREDVVARTVEGDREPYQLLEKKALFGAEKGGERPRIKKAYYYVLSFENDNLSDIEEVSMVIDGGACSGGASDSDERDVADDEEEPEPDREDESDEETSGEPKCGPGFDRSYWEEKDEKCICVNEEKQDYKELRSKEVAGREVSDRKYCDNDAAVGEERTSPRDPDSIDPSLPSEPEGGECQGGEAYIDDFSFKDDDGNVIEKCICNLDYKEVDMRLCRAQEIDPTLPPQPEEPQSDEEVRCYTNEYCGSIDAGSCDGGSCSRATYGTCSGPSNEPDETVPNEWCGDRFGSKGGGDKREDRPSDGGGRHVEIQKESCNGEAYWDTTSFSSKACVCTDDYLIVPNSYCE